jgi:hypothetical protein
MSGKAMMSKSGLKMKVLKYGPLERCQTLQPGLLLRISVRHLPYAQENILRPEPNRSQGIRHSSQTLAKPKCQTPVIALQSPTLILSL